MSALQFISETHKFCNHLGELKLNRIAQKKKQVRTYRLNKAQKILILQKTNHKCHVCGGEISLSDFAADHVQSHSSSVNNTLDNFLPACEICNSYRWFFSPEEIRWILKMGVWLRTQIEKQTSVGKTACEKFLTYEKKRDFRRK